MATVPVNAADRSSTPRLEFIASHPCPATGKTGAPCPGYVVDHVKPLCAGGADHSANMQWQTIAAAKVKDVEEKRACLANPRAPKTAS